jgi:hypothetical protein
MFSGKTNSVLLALLVSLSCSSVCFAAGWAGLRTSGGGTAGWQPLICDGGGGWRSCELPVNITLTSSPPSLIATGQSSTVTATVTDYYGLPIAGNALNWSTTDGYISAGQTATDANGASSVTLTSSRTLGGTVIAVSTIENDGSGAIWVPFIDNFVYYPSDYTGWVAYDPVYGCGVWSPDPSTVDSGTWFTQSTSCYQNYYRYRQDRQVSEVTGSVINVGGAIAEYTTSAVPVSQGAAGTKVTTPPTPPPSATPVCSSYGDRSDGVNGAWTYWDVSTMGGTGINNTPATLWYNGHTGLSMPNRSGYLDYNGMRFTVGSQFYTNSIGKNGTTWNFKVCRVPL